MRIGRSQDQALQPEATSSYSPVNIMVRGTTQRLSPALGGDVLTGSIPDTADSVDLLGDRSGDQAMSPFASLSAGNRYIYLCDTWIHFLGHDTCSYNSQI